MKMNRRFVVLGHDARMQAAAAALTEAGCTLLDPVWAEQADCVVLPVRLEESSPELALALALARPDARLLGGAVSPGAAARARAAGFALQDYMQWEELALLNAIPTAEGCLALLLEGRRTTLWDSELLLLGYGRVGQAIGRRLLALGVRVTAVDCNPARRAAALADGCRALAAEQLATAAQGADTVVNTVPAQLLDESLLVCLAPGARVIELAGHGAADAEAAARLGVRLVPAPGLPGKCAPVTAGRFIARAVLSILNQAEQEERG